MKTKVKLNKKSASLFISYLVLFLMPIGLANCSSDDNSEPDPKPTGAVEVTTFAEGATFNFPSGIAMDAQGTLYIADAANHVIRKVTSDGQVSLVAGSTKGFADGVGADAKFNVPSGITIDKQGDLYIADSFNHNIRKITQN